MEFTPRFEIEKIPDLVDELFTHVLYDEQPLFIGDQATIWDVSMIPEDKELIDRCSQYYGIALSATDLQLPLWKLLRQINERRSAQLR
jgi:hypothetical protein